MGKVPGVHPHPHQHHLIIIMIIIIDTEPRKKEDWCSGPNTYNSRRKKMFSLILSLLLIGEKLTLCVWAQIHHL